MLFTKNNRRFFTAEAIDDCYIISTSLANFRSYMFNFPIIEACVIRNIKQKLTHRSQLIDMRKEIKVEEDSKEDTIKRFFQNDPLRFGQLSKFIEGDLLTKLEQLNGKIGKIGNDPLMDVDKVVKRNEPDVKNAKKKIENWRKVKKLEEVESKEEEFFDVAKIVGQSWNPVKDVKMDKIRQDLENISADKNCIFELTQQTEKRVPQKLKV